MQLTHFGLDPALAEVIETGAVFDPVATWVLIFSDIVNNGVNTLLSDVTPAPIASYPRKPITTWGTPYRLSDGSPVVDAAIQHWTPPDNTHPTVVTGFALVNSATVGDLLGFVILPTPVALNTTTDVWSLIVRLTMQQSGNYSVDVSFNG